MAQQNEPMPRTMPLPEPDKSKCRLRFGDWLLDPASHSLRHGDGHTATLGRTAMALLEFFVAHPLTPLTREQLSGALDREYLACDRLIDVLVSQIRRTLGRTAEGAAYIRTVRSVGYVFVVPVIKV